MRDRTAEVAESGYAALVLVCTNARESEYAACAGAGGADVRDAVADWLRDRDAFWTTVRVAETNCLGLCSEDGTAVAVQPRDHWYSDVTPADVPALLRAEFGEDAAEVEIEATSAD